VILNTQPLKRIARIVTALAKPGQAIKPGMMLRLNAGNVMAKGIQLLRGGYNERDKV
jgi:hypothetical protein